MKRHVHLASVDRLYREPQTEVKDFCFDEAVAFVFDNMISRSVPLYGEVQKLCALIAGKLLNEDARIIDLGCSTGTTFCEIANHLGDKKVQMIGVDNSRAMLEQCKRKMQTLAMRPEPLLVHSDIESYHIQDADLVLLNYTLQFVNGLHARRLVLRKVYDGLRPGGHLLLSEKVTHNDPPMSDLLTELHLDFKQANGYSKLEIAQKRDSLERTLIPLTLQENIAMLTDAGFETVEIVFKSFNFVTLLARKGDAIDTRAKG